MAPNRTVERDARKSGARPSLWTLGVTRISSRALSHLSLRRHPNRSSAAPAETHQLQLLDLPALWRPLGVLQGRNSSRDRSPREHYRVRLGRQDAQNSPVSQLWVRHTLGATKAKAKQLARGERTELRAKRARVCAYPSLRWS